jgi:hypothetical protein
MSRDITFLLQRFVYSEQANTYFVTMLWGNSLGNCPFGGTHNVSFVLFLCTSDFLSAVVSRPVPSEIFCGKGTWNAAIRSVETY